MNPSASDLLALERSPLFADVPREQRLGMLAMAQLRNLTVGTRLPPVTDDPSVCLVLSGRLGLFADTNAHLPLTTLGPGACTGEQTILGEQGETARVAAIEPTRLAVFTMEDLWRTMRDHPRIAFNLLQILSERLRIDNERRAPENANSTDSLTGLHNRQWMEEMFGRELQRCERSGIGAALLMIAIDRFKQTSDSAGQLAGDRLLAHLGKLLQRTLRPRDLMGKFDGEKFCALLLDVNADQASRGAERVREQAEQKPVTITRSMEIGYTVSTGIAEWHTGQTLESLLLAAGSALQTASRAGGNRIEIAR